MWSGWARDLAAGLRGRDRARPAGAALPESSGYDDATGRADAHGQLAATPMARIRELDPGGPARRGDRASTTRAAALPRPGTPRTRSSSRVPLTDLAALFGALRATGRRLAVATSDDRDPTERTLAAAGVDGLLDAVVCADDGLAVKPAPDMVLAICRASASPRPGPRSWGIRWPTWRWAGRPGSAAASAS